MPVIGAVVGERAERAVVAGVVAVLAIPDRLAAHLEQVRAPLPGQVVAERDLVVDRRCR